MSLSGLAKFLIGFTIAIGLLIGAGVAGALYFVTKLTSPPPRPVFANERNVNKPKLVVAKNLQKPGTTTSANASSPASEASSSDDQSPKPLEAGAYKARVTWSSGLSIRNNPSLESEKVGGVAYNETIVVLGESDDKRWLKIRQEEGEREGWVKAGNVRRIEEEQTQAANQ